MTAQTITPIPPVVKPQLTAERLRELLHYDPDTGLFTRRVSTAPSVKVGDIAGTLNSKGYIKIRLDGYLYAAHRLAWLYVTGAFPENEVDHIDGVTDHNWFSNLRDVTHQQNMTNCRGYRTNTTGFRGVYFFPKTGRYHSKIRVNSKLIHLGSFSTPEAASEAYETAATVHFKEFKRADRH